MNQPQNPREPTALEKALTLEANALEHRCHELARSRTSEAAWWTFMTGCLFITALATYLGFRASE